jgi:hypothetical protein
MLWHAIEMERKKIEKNLLMMLANLKTTKKGLTNLSRIMAQLMMEI